MDISPLVPAGRQVIQSYGEGGFRISGSRYEGALLVFPSRSLAWPVSAPAEITLDSLAEVLAEQPAVELLLVGSGPRLILLPASLRRDLRAKGIVVEAMDTGAACRTYNVLMAEERRVAAALLPVV